MNINRRKFFRVCAAGMAAAAIPTFLQGDKVQGKIIDRLPLPTPNGKERAGFYGWSENGFAVLDNRRVLLGGFDVTPEAEEAIREGGWEAEPGLWNIQKGCDHDTESLAAALEMPICPDLLHRDEDAKDIVYQKFDPQYKVQVPTYDNVQPIDPEVWEKVREQKKHMMERIILRSYGPEYGKPNRNGDIFVMPERGDLEIIVGLETKTNEAKRLS